MVQKETLTYTAPMLEAGRSARRGSLSSRLDLVSASGIRRFFELIETTDGVISLGVGEPDFTTPNHISQAAIRSIEAGKTWRDIAAAWETEEAAFRERRQDFLID